MGPFERSSSVARGLRQTVYLLALPPRVSVFYLRALAIALIRGDRRSLVGSTRPRELAALLRAARGRRRVVEIGTGTAWTAISLLLSDPARRVITYDPLDYAERHWYLDLLDAQSRARLELIRRPGEHADGAIRPDFVFIDSSHQREETEAAFLTWSQQLAPGGVIAFHDYSDPAWPEVREVVEALGLTGRTCGFLFLWSAPARRRAEAPTRAGG